MTDPQTYKLKTEVRTPKYNTGKITRENFPCIVRAKDVDHQLYLLTGFSGDDNVNCPQAIYLLGLHNGDLTYLPRNSWDDDSAINYVNRHYTLEPYAKLVIETPE